MRHGCFNCGEVGGELYQDDRGRVHCQVCGEPTVVTLETALDLLREVELQGNLPRYTQEIIDEQDYSELI